MVEAVVMIDQEPSKSSDVQRPARGLMPIIKTEYERMCDELGGPADIGIALKWPKASLAPYCRDYGSRRVLPVLVKFQADQSCARRHWPWAAFAISHYAFEQKERSQYADEPAPKEVEALLAQIAQASRTLHSELLRLDALASRLDDRTAPLRRAHIRWLDGLVSQAAAGHLANDLNDSEGHLLIVDFAKQAFLDRLVDVESAAKMAMGRLDKALLERERGQTAAGLPNFVFRCSAIWKSLTGRKPSANKVTRRDGPGNDPDFVVFVQEFAKLGVAPAPSREQVASSLRKVCTRN
jgi:hypothetical protein